MEKFKKISSTITPFDKANVDTDQIVPKQFLKLVQKTGFGKYLFYNWRFDKDGNPNYFKMVIYMLSSEDKVMMVYWQL